MSRRPLAILALLLIGSPGCGDDGGGWECVVTEDNPAFTQQIGCRPDFDAVASLPLNASIPGALSTKTVVDRLDGDNLYFQNSRTYPIHYDFASVHLSGDGRPIVPLLAEFNVTEYYSPDRRFLLGALTYYEGPAVWCYEIAPYDTATAEMVAAAYYLIRDNSYIGADLYFHPTSDAVEVTAEGLPDDVKVITTEELFAGIDYQPLNLGTSMGQLRFVRAEDLETEYVGFRDITVLDAVPNDISVTSGIITAAFQTPLSHINVLSQNRGTPNMALRGAFDDDELRALQGKWVELDVGAFAYSVTEVTKAEADAWWEAHKPDAVQVPGLDLTVTELTDIEDVLDVEGLGLQGALDAAIPAFGGKASHYGGFAEMDGAVTYPDAFAVPVYYYWQHMESHGFHDQVAALIADETFQSDPAVRDQQLNELRDAIKAAPVDEELEGLLLAKLAADYPGIRTRFRSSTNAEDLDGFTGAGLYTSRSGDPNDPAYPVMDAVRTVWSSVWYFRAYEEREYRSIDHTAVGMALLVHRSFPDEEANGVAVTGNLFDTAGLEPAYYINVQVGEESVVQPEPGVTSDQLLLYHDMPNQPIVFLAHSSLVPEGETVLTRAQTLELGDALKVIHLYWSQLYGPATPEHFYAMDVEFKFDGEVGEEPALWVKQARPYPGWGE